MLAPKIAAVWCSGVYVQADIVSVTDIPSAALPFVRLGQTQETNAPDEPSLAASEPTLVEPRISIRRSAVILHAASLANALLKQESISNVTELVKANRVSLSSTCSSTTIFELERTHRSTAVFQALDHYGDGKVNGLELARAHISLESDLRGSRMTPLMIPTQMQCLTRLNSKNCSRPMCDIFFVSMAGLHGYTRSLEGLEEYSLERVNEQINVQKSFRNGVRRARL